MITKTKRKARLIKKFTKGAIRLSTANGSHIRKNKKSTFKGIVHCLCKGEVLKELKVDIMQFMSIHSRRNNIKRREELIKELYGQQYTYKQVMESIRTENKKRVKEEAEILKKYGFGEVK
ncbi:hypothetical protein [uncultured Cetobacterium sp.]|uniref:hypothetical protein n=1 Tax=uncultured Cetobacterium sp. TaxID=527638 RepID=UPI00260A716C|nr:hypothetical protein [uncultured Cetobacterium sp.]